MIQINHFKKYYGSQLVLHINSFSLEKGIHWVKGGNGSGKTTFFKTLAGLLLFQGEVVFNGRFNLQKDLIACRRIVNYGEAEPLYPAFVTGNDIMQLVAESKQADSAQLQAVTEALGVHTFSRQAVGSYSSGMLKKLSLAIAFLGQPQVILLDEPLITLDQAAVQVICNLIREYHRKGVTFLISSHQAFEEGKLSFSSILMIENQTIAVDKSVPSTDFQVP